MDLFKFDESFISGTVRPASVTHNNKTPLDLKKEMNIEYMRFQKKKKSRF